jgi:hypothetical protein
MTPRPGVFFASVFLASALAAAGMVTACSMKRPAASFPRQELIAEIKDFQRTLGFSGGFSEQGNFRSYSETQKAYYRCYYTGKLELPESYEQLRLAEGSAAGCSLDETKYDVFFYAMEAAASGSAPVTQALAEAPLERLLVVVPHEDFHNQAEVEKAAPEIAEAASTLIGFLSASEFAKGKYGAASETFLALNREARLFLQKARIVNSYFDRVAAIYTAYRSKEISQEQTLARKGELFRDLEQECASLSPEPVSFNRCPGVGNNAALAFERTYTRYYPLLYEFSAAQGQDASLTVEGLKRLMSGKPRSERDLLTAQRKIATPVARGALVLPMQASESPAANPGAGSDTQR